MNRERKHRDAATGQYTTAADAATRPGETVSESVPARHETPDVAELRRLLDAARAGVESITATLDESRAIGPIHPDNTTQED